MNKIKQFLHSKTFKKVSAIVCALAICALSCVSAFATGEDTTDTASELTSAFSSAISTMKGDVFSMLAVALPAALAIVGAIFGIKKAIAFFKSTSRG